MLLGDDIDIMTDLERDYTLMKGGLLDNNTEYTSETHVILFGILRGKAYEMEFEERCI